MSWRRSSAPYSRRRTPSQPWERLHLAKIIKKSGKSHSKGIMIIEGANKRKLQDCELRNFGEVFENPTRNIIDFESGRKALEKVDFDDEQNRVRLMERSGVPSRLPEDCLEFLMTVVFFVMLLLGLVGGVVASWRF